MKLRMLVGPLVCTALVACAELKTHKSRANDPYSSLSQSDIYVQKGIQYMEAGNYEVALQDLMKATELDGENSEAYNALAVLYQRLDQPADAERRFKRPCRSIPRTSVPATTTAVFCARVAATPKP